MRPASIRTSRTIYSRTNHCYRPVAAVEIQTARYSEAKSDADRLKELNALQESTELAKRLGLNVHMGHGLNYWNVQAVAQIPGVEELNIGHSIVSRAVLVGMQRAVREMKDAICSAR